jgi:hypothetical protein
LPRNRATPPITPATPNTNITRRKAFTTVSVSTGFVNRASETGDETPRRRYFAFAAT